MFGDPTAIDWEMDTGSGTVAEYLVNNARDLAAFNQVIRNQCAQRNIAMTAEQEAELDQQMADAVENSGGQDNFELALKEVNRTEEGLRSMYSASNFLYPALQEQLFPAQDAAALTAEELAQWASDKGLMQVKHILFKTVDDSGSPLSDEEIAAAKQKAEDTLAQLQASDDMENLFDQLMNELSEDGRYADGTLGAPTATSSARARWSRSLRTPPRLWASTSSAILWRPATATTSCSACPWTPRWPVRPGPASRMPASASR